MAWRLTEKSILHHARLKFEKVNDGICLEIRERFNANIDVLYGVQGLYAASKSVERDEWKAYIRELNLPAKFPGILALRYVERVFPPNIEKFIASVRTDRTLSHGGYPDFSIRPFGKQSEYFVVKYVEPMENNEEMLGRELGADAILLEVIEKSVKTGKPLMTAPLTIPTVPEKNPAFMVYVPVYRNGYSVTSPEERELALEGLINGVFYPKNLFSDFLEDPMWHEDYSKVRIQIYSNSESTRRFTDAEKLYEHLPKHEKILWPSYEPLVQTTRLSVAGRVWTFQFSANAQDVLQLTEWYFPMMVLGLGVILSGMLFLVLFSLSRSHQEALRLAKRMTRDLRESEARFRTICESSPLGIFLADENGDWVYANRQCSDIVGLSSKDLLTGKWFQRIQPDDREPALFRWQQCVREQKNMEATFRIIHSEDKVVWTVMKTAVVGGGGVSKGFVGILEDITHRKETEERLFRAQKMESVGQLAGGIAHDFNNLLMIIRGYTEYLLKAFKKDDAHYSEILEIKTASERGAELTKQLLTYSRRQIIHPEVVNLNDLLKSILTVCQRLLGEENELELELDPQLINIEVDPGQLQQVLVNLVLNARDAIPEHGKVVIRTANVNLPSILAENESADSDQEYVELTVTDNGMGMTEEVRQRLFEPFFTTKEKGKGTGLGLAICYGVVRQYEGRIEVESVVGKGTAVKIYLPAAGAEKALLKKRSTRKAHANLPHGTETVLLVEDEHALRNLLAKILRDYGYRVIDSPDGEAGWKEFQKRKPGEIALLLTDIVMPFCSGKELARRVQDLDPAVKVIFMSGHPEAMITQREVDSADLSLLHKPFAQDALLVRVREMLDSPTH